MRAAAAPRDDLAAARLLLTDVELPARMACFHAQQAAEKALKALLVHAAIQFRTTHDLAVPGGAATRTGSVGGRQPRFQPLQQWAMDARYPGDLPDITAAEAVTVVAIADQIVAAVGAALRKNSPA